MTPTLTNPWYQAAQGFGAEPDHPLLAYRDDPAAFVRDMIVWKQESLTAYQAEVLERLPTERRIAVKGPHGLGKTALSALIILWFSLTRDAAGVDWKLPTTASGWHQLRFYLWPEVHKWAARLRWERLGRNPFDERSELLTMELKLRHGSAFAVASDKPARVEGAHADSLLYLFDEAKSIPDEPFDAAEGAFSGAGAGTAMEAYAVALSTPGEPRGRFFDIHRRAAGFEDWGVRSVSLEEAVVAGRVAADWAEQRAKQWGKQSALFQNRVLGLFASSEEDGVIPLEWVELAVERWKARFGPKLEDWPRGIPDTFTAVGADIARAGADQTAFSRRYGNVVAPLEYQPYTTSTMPAAGALVGILRAHGGRAVIDSVGVGAGVFDRVQEQSAEFPGATVVAFGAGESTHRKDRSGEMGFVNKRSAAWWNLREMLDPDSGEDVLLPPDDLLIGDLTAPKWRPMSGGRIGVESKDDIRKRLKRSTDSGDAVVQAFWPDGSAPLVAPIEIAGDNYWGLGSETSEDPWAGLSGDEGYVDLMGR